MQETQVTSLGQENPLEKGMATQSSILAWKYHRRRSLVYCSPWCGKESDRTEPLMRLTLTHSGHKTVLGRQ